MHTHSSGERYFIVLFIMGFSIAFLTTPASAQINSADLPIGSVDVGMHPVLEFQDNTPDPTNTPDAQGTITYTIAVGDTAWDIAARYGMELEDLYILNGIDENTILYVGDELLIVGARTATPAATLNGDSVSVMPTEATSATPQPTETKAAATVAPVSRRDTKPPSKDEVMQGLVIASFVIGAILIFLCATFCIKNKPPIR